MSFLVFKTIYELLFQLSLTTFSPLFRLEKRNQSSPLKSSLLHASSAKVVSTILKIGWEYLYKNMDNSLFTGSARSNLKERQQEDLTKKIKLSYSEINEKEFDKDTSLIDEHVHTTMNLLNSLEVGGKEHAISLGENMKLLDLTVKYFYSNLEQKDFEARTSAINCTFSIMMRLCLTRRYSRIIALQELIEGALYIHNNLFESNGELRNDNGVKVKRSSDKSLIKLNQVQNSTQSSIRCVLHAGVIGQGLKNPTKEANEPTPCIKNAFLSAIIACCEHEVKVIGTP